MMPPSFSSIALSLLTILGTLFSHVTTHTPPKDAPASAIPANTRPSSPHPEKLPRAVSPPTLTATAAAVFDPIANTYLFKKDTGRALPIASISKIVTALAARERAGKESRIPITPEAVAAEGDAGNFSIGEVFTIADLTTAMMVESSNDAAVAVAQHIGMAYGGDTFEDSQRIFTRLMNKKAWEAGMRNTHFQNPTGLDVRNETEASNVASAEDLVSLVLYTMREHQEIFSWSTLPEYTIISEEGGEHLLKNTNTFAATLPNFIGGKTGFTDNTGGALIVIAEIPMGTPKFFIVLGSTYTGRFTDMQTLIEWTREVPSR